jgi:hypothetical protein
MALRASARKGCKSDIPKIRRSKAFASIKSHSGKSHLFPTGNSIFDRRALLTIQQTVQSWQKLQSMQELESPASKRWKSSVGSPPAACAVRFESGVPTLGDLSASSLRPPCPRLAGREQPQCGQKIVDKIVRGYGKRPRRSCLTCPISLRSR